jgi:hypothetical protein
MGLCIDLEVESQMQCSCMPNHEARLKYVFFEGGSMYMHVDRLIGNVKTALD